MCASTWYKAVHMEAQPETASAHAMTRMRRGSFMGPGAEAIIAPRSGRVPAGVAGGGGAQAAVAAATFAIKSFALTAFTRKSLAPWRMPQTRPDSWFRLVQMMTGMCFVASSCAMVLL